MRPGRRLLPAEAELWARVAQTVTPLDGKRRPPRPAEASAAPAPPVLPPRGRAKPSPVPPRPAEAPARRVAEERRPSDSHGLDASWDRKLARGALQPDFTLDLHGASLDAAYVRLDHGLTLALAQGARVVLLITGRSRPSDDHAGRGTRRGAIRAKFLDWLTAGAHASRIAAIRPAHPRHGGAGALYLVLRRAR